LCGCWIDIHIITQPGNPFKTAYGAIHNRWAEEKNRANAAASESFYLPEGAFASKPKHEYNGVGPALVQASLPWESRYVAVLHYINPYHYAVRVYCLLLLRN
jgi:hypothetical protein